MHEIKLLSSLNSKLQNLNKNQIYEVAKNSLINEKIKKIEIYKYKKKLEINNKYLNKLVEDNYRKLDIKSEEDFDKFLKKRMVWV